MKKFFLLLETYPNNEQEIHGPFSRGAAEELGRKITKDNESGVKLISRFVLVKEITPRRTTMGHILGPRRIGFRILRLSCRFGLHISVLSTITRDQCGFRYEFKDCACRMGSRAIHELLTHNQEHKDSLPLEDLFKKLPIFGGPPRPKPPTEPIN